MNAIALILLTFNISVIAQTLTTDDFQSVLTRAEAGDSEAQFMVGGMYQNGVGVPQNYTKANEWFVKGSAQGNQHAQSSLALAYRAGWGVKQDVQKANEIDNKLANEGDTYSQYVLGSEFFIKALQNEIRTATVQQNAYFEGQQPADYQTNLVFACKWFTIAKARGWAGASRKLEETLSYMNQKSTLAGQIMAANFVPVAPRPLVFGETIQIQTIRPSALTWQFQQATNGFPRYQFELGVRYLKGQEVETNRNLALFWISNAAAKGYSEAIAFLQGTNLQNHVERQATKIR